MRKFVAIAAATMLALGVSASPSSAAGSQVVVSGIGQVSVKRDQATTYLSVSVKDSSAKAAMAGATRSFNAVRSAVLAAGAKEDDLTTAGLSLAPEYEYNNGSTPTITGYRATIGLSVISAVNLAASIVDTAVETGGDLVSVGGISFDTANPDLYTATARTKAIAAAKAKALAYAKSLGMKLGKPVKVVETSSPTPMPIYAAGDKVMASSVTLDPGTAKVSVSVEVTFTLR